MKTSEINEIVNIFPCKTWCLYRECFLSYTVRLAVRMEIGLWSVEVCIDVPQNCFFFLDFMIFLYHSIKKDLAAQYFLLFAKSGVHWEISVFHNWGIQ